jgi:DNA-directed RNA polymerase specialized sigma24 family protein
MVLAARQAGAAAFLSRETVGFGVAGAVEFVLTHDFTVTEDIAHALENHLTGDLSVLPGRRQYNRLTPRIEQALWLCVIEGLPAELAAEEMGVSISTVRSYIKEGYRILESEDDTAYPISASPAERAFRRFTALEEDEMILQTHMPWQPAA